MSKRSAVLLCAGTMPVFATPALGQSTKQASDSTTSDRAADATSDGLPDIIVTARRWAGNAQEIPAALSVVDGELIGQSYVVNTQRLTALIPSLNYSSASPRNTALTNRGLGSSVVAVGQAK